MKDRREYLREFKRRQAEQTRPIYDVFIKWFPLELADLDGEVWRAIDERYQVSSFGRMKSLFNGERILKPMYSKDGYLRINLWVGGKMKTRRIHVLVAEAFLDNPGSKPEVNHIDGCPLNNHVSNLEWVTSSENHLHAIKAGLQPSGENHPSSHLTVDDVAWCREVYIKGDKNFGGAALARMFNMTKEAMRSLLVGEAYCNVGDKIHKANEPLLPTEQVAEIKRRYRRGVRGCGCEALAREFGISSHTVLRIVREG